MQAREYYPLSVDLTDPAKQQGKPQWLRLPNGQEHTLKTWKDILLKTAELVLQSQDKLLIPLPDKAGKKNHLLHWSPPKAGLSFSKLDYQKKSVYLYTNYSARDCVANALYLLQQLPKGAATGAAIAF